MSWRTVLSIPILLLLTFAAACASKSSAPATPTPAPASTQPASASNPPAPVATPTSAASSTAALSLVYSDSSKGQGSDIYVAAFDGANTKKIASLPAGVRVMDVRGNTLVAGSRTDFTVIDLKTGATRNTKSKNNISFGVFINDQTFIFTTGAGCGPPGESVATLSKLDIASLQITELSQPSGANLNVAGFDANQVAVTLRGCDVGVNNVAIYNLADNKLASTLMVRGCGQAAVSFSAKKAFVGLRACNQSAEHLGNDYTMVDFAATTPVLKDIKIGSGEVNNFNLIFRPGQPQAVVGANAAPTGTPGPGTTKSAGIFSLDLSTGAFTNLIPADGPEQYPVAWSADGRYLIVSTVRAQGNCDYTYFDATTKQSKPLAKDFTWCGANGDVIGWTTLK